MRLLILGNNDPRRGLDLGEEIRAIEEGLEEARHRDSVDVRVNLATRVDDLVRHLSGDEPTVVHYLGHGSANGIHLRDGDGSLVTVSGRQLRRFLAGRQVQLLVLNSCDSARQAEEVAPVVPAVIGTTLAVEDHASTEFSRAFYRSLGRGRTVARAFQDGRAAVDLRSYEDSFTAFGTLDDVLVHPGMAWRRPLGVAAGLVAIGLLATLVGWFDVLDRPDSTAELAEVTVTTEATEPDPGSDESDQIAETADPEETNQATSRAEVADEPSDPPAPGLLVDRLGVWSGLVTDETGRDTRLTMVLAEAAPAPGGVVGEFGYDACRGVLHLGEASSTAVVLRPDLTPSLASCQFDGRIDLVLDGETASYEFQPDDGTSRSTGTLERSELVFHTDEIGWPTDKRQAPTSFMIWLGACVAGDSPPCSPTGLFPDWSACNDDYCLVDLGGPELFSRSGPRYLLTLPDTTSNAAIELMFIGMSDREALLLLQ